MSAAEPAGRSWVTVLFVPADKPAMLSKAQGRGACALMIDLEDAIAPGDKESARETLLRELAGGALDGEARVYVRINAAAEGGVEDATALRSVDLAGLMIPKVERRQDVLRISEALDRCRPLPLIPQIESAAGLLALPDLLAVDLGLAAVAFGGEDLAADLGVLRSVDGVELLFPRAWLSICARAAGVPAIDTVFTALDDRDGLLEEAHLAAQLGFAGKLLVHPGQIAPVEEAFTPSSQQLAWARRVVAAVREAGGGYGAARVDGKMVDAPVIAQAERILARAGEVGATG